MIAVDFSALLGSDMFNQWGVPLLIFLARICDVSIGTLRVSFVSQGTRNWAAALGFFEVLIWLTAVSFILQNLTNLINYVAFAGGFAVGTYVGLRVEEKMAKGLIAITAITNRDAGPLISHLKEQNYGLTSVSARGATGRVRLILSVIRRRQFNDLREIIERFHPNAFIAVQPVRSVSKDVRPSLGPSGRFINSFLVRK